MGLNYGGYDIARAHVSGTHGRVGLGVAQLCFSLGFDFHSTKMGVFNVDNLHIDVIVGTPTVGSNSLFVGNAVAESPFFATTQPHNEARLVRVTLSEGQILHLEKIRAGRDIEFELQLKMIAHGSHGSQPLFESVRVPLNSSTWARVLTELQGPEYLVLGVSLPRCEHDHPLRFAVERVRSAHALLVNGRYDSAIADCRLALDSIIQITDAAPILETALRTPSSQRETLSKTERELLLLNALRNYTHLAHHLGPNGRPEYYSRDDAALTVSTTAALVGNSVVRPSLSTEGQP